MRKGIAAIVLAATIGTGVVAFKPREAEAQAMMPPSGQMTATPQGLIGTALLGAEAVIMIEGLAGVRNRWILIGTGAAGLVAGGVGGFFIDQALDGGTFGGPCPAAMGPCGPSAVSTALLVVGLGLIIPTAIVYANATMYRPENDARAQQDDNAPANTPLEESTGTGGSTTTGGAASGTTGTSGGTTTTPAGGSGGGRRVRRRGVPEALLNFDPGRFRVGMPSIFQSRTYSLEEMRQYGAPAVSEFRIPVLSATF